MAADAVLEKLDKRWRSVCKVLFMGDIGPLSDYAEWLARNNEPVIHRKSSVSGKPVAYAIGEYARDSRWISLEEVDFHKSYPPLSINQLKDVESIVEAVRERAHYAGNVVLGNSGFVQESSSISDSFYMHETGKFGDCRYLAHCTLGRLCEDCFGCNGIGESQYCVKSYETFRVKRCFEFWMGQNCSDCHYTHNLSSCSECMFCFNLKNKRHAIGNLELEPAKYKAIKEALVGQIAGELRGRGSAPSLMDLVGELPQAKPAMKLRLEKKPKGNMAPIEQEFAKTCELVLGKRLGGGIDDYSAWLLHRVRKFETWRSCASGEPVRRWDYCNYFMLPHKRLLMQAEALDFGEKERISEAEAGRLTLANAASIVGRLAFFSTEYEEGANANVIECPTPTQSANCYRTSPVVYSKHCAYSFWPRSCEHAYGCNAMFDSEFCIRCYHSVKLKRCFECDSCSNCAGAYFCHNCENVQDSMFCFNAKNLRYAIGNAEVGRERFLEAKKRLLDWVLKGVEGKEELALDIYNIAAEKKA